MYFSFPHSTKNLSSNLPSASSMWLPTTSSAWGLVPGFTLGLQANVSSSACRLRPGSAFPWLHHQSKDSSELLRDPSGYPAAPWLSIPLAPPGFSFPLASPSSSLPPSSAEPLSPPQSREPAAPPSARRPIVSPDPPRPLLPPPSVSPRVSPSHSAKAPPWLLPPAVSNDSLSLPPQLDYELLRLLGGGSTVTCMFCLGFSLCSHLPVLLIIS